ncbi:MAG TPA: hypothetical protein VMC07_02070 [Candidatus Omnitrophota bacterium]|nr:hypothetical protein [Candidatus Omnitrophota bacterium]
MNKRVHFTSFCNFSSKNRKGSTLLVENIIFIILNLVFLAILIFFLLSKQGNPAVLEEKYAKEIALALDSAKPGMAITLNMEDAINSAKSSLGENSINSIVNIDKNVVTVKLRENGGYSYSFFNNVVILNCYMNQQSNEYLLFIGGANEQEGCR